MKARWLILVVILCAYGVQANQTCSMLGGDVCTNHICTANELTDIDQSTVCCSVACTPIFDGATWVFLGDSITDAQLYTSYLESYYHLRYPQHELHFRGEGRGGSTIPEVTTEGRYERRVYSWEPDVVTVMFGHNGAFTADQFEQDLSALMDFYIIGANAAEPILYGPHPTNTMDGKPILGEFSTRIATLGKARKIGNADIWHFLLPYWQLNLQYGSPVNLQFIDNVHPGPSGHLNIAYAILDRINATRDVSSVRINGSSGALISQDHATISSISVSASGLSFVRLDHRLPMAYDDAAREGIRLIPQILDMNRYMLTVTNLEPGTYEVYVDGVLVEVLDSSALANGWNMANMTKGPIYDQLKDVLNKIRDKEGISRTTYQRTGPPWTGVHAYKSAADGLYNSGLRGEQLKGALSSYVQAILPYDSALHAAAQPRPRTFLIRRAQACIGCAVCGNEVIEPGEACDGGQQSCTTGGYPGSQNCTAACGWGACVMLPNCTLTMPSTVAPNEAFNISWISVGATHVAYRYTGNTISALNGTPSPTEADLFYLINLTGSSKINATSGSSTFSVCFDRAGITGTYDQCLARSPNAVCTKTITVSGTPLPKEGDINGDNSVNLQDIQNIIVDWGKTSGISPGNDPAPPFGLVDLFDVMVVVRNWGR